MNTEPVPPGTLLARLLTDIMIPSQFSAAIRAQGYDVAEVRAMPCEIQKDDHAILAEATRQKRAVVTCNYSDRSGNFCLIHEEWRARRKYTSELFSSHRHKSATVCDDGKCAIGCFGFLNQRTADELKN